VYKEGKKMDRDNFGEFLKSLRKQHHMTQTELAELLNVTTASVSKWETGKNLPSYDILDKICELFHLSHNELHNPAFAFSNSNSNEDIEIASPEEVPPSTQIKPFGNRSKMLLVALGSFIAGIAITCLLFLLL